ncbi:hypothetical protein E1262_13790 [Jiangella aurantiaca]|uniref:Sigma-70 family RNA polymerase sigma factor n=1 Tax=Jiangella aurantiaca TaxID=2530373 RepID=A0A4R5AGE7_9ACTN|nr:sigma-70 domain-containing protein [Jiangella aurantiaca]TDD69092.1 hypothetical protein E1262_13790 [Jiangella aurantiaca]
MTGVPRSTRGGVVIHRGPPGRAAGRARAVRDRPAGAAAEARVRGGGRQSGPAAQCGRALAVRHVAAAQRFDPSRGKNFLAYAVPTIRGEVKKCFRDHGWTVRPPQRVQELAAAGSAASQEVSQTKGAAPTPAELAEHLGVDVDEVVEAGASHDCFTTASLDYLGADGETTSRGGTGGSCTCGSSSAGRSRRSPTSSA